VLNTKGTRAFDGDNFDNDRLLFAARTCERWFHAWRFKGAPSTAEFLHGTNLDHRHWQRGYLAV